MSTEVIYNVTVKVTHGISVEWLKWLKNVHVPEVMATGCFRDARIVRLLETDDSEGPTYAIQYFAPDFDHYNQYIQQHATGMREKSYKKWGDQFIAFRSVMEVVG